MTRVKFSVSIGSKVLLPEISSELLYNLIYTMYIPLLWDHLDLLENRILLYNVLEGMHSIAC